MQALSTHRPLTFRRRAPAKRTTNADTPNPLGLRHDDFPKQSLRTYLTLCSNDDGHSHPLTRLAHAKRAIIATANAIARYANPTAEDYHTKSHVSYALLRAIDNGNAQAIQRALVTYPHLQTFGNQQTLLNNAPARRRIQDHIVTLHETGIQQRMTDNDASEDPPLIKSQKREALLTRLQAPTTRSKPYGTPRPTTSPPIQRTWQGSFVLTGTQTNHFTKAR